MWSKQRMRTPENPHRGLIPKSPKFGGHKMAIFGDLDETLCPKVPIWGVYGAFRSAISSAPPSVAPEVQNFGTGRSIFGGLVLYISAPETPNSGICIMHMGSKIRIFGGNGMRARSLYSGVLRHEMTKLIAGLCPNAEFPRAPCGDFRKHVRINDHNHPSNGRANGPLQLLRT